MKMKTIWQSKTFWFNLITGLLAVVSEVAQIFPISGHPAIYASVISIGNIILRLLTTTGITSGKDS